MQLKALIFDCDGEMVSKFDESLERSTPHGTSC